MNSLRVLHVEDEADIREVVEISLGLDPDLVIRSCSSGHDALEAVADWRPDIILLDVRMPVMDGPTTLAHLRGNARTASIPVVFMTARAQSSDIEHFRSLGAAGVIPKPFNPMNLAASVRAYADPMTARCEMLRAVFVRRVNDDAAALAGYRSALREKSGLTAALAGTRDIAHGLAGASGIFGFPEVGDAAAALEKTIIVEDAGPGAVEKVELAIDRLLARIDGSMTRSFTLPAHRKM